MQAYKEGIQYSSGIVLTEAKKTAKHLASTSVQNPKGTSRETIRSKYHHPKFCMVVGHSSVASKECFMHKCSKRHKEAAFEIIMNELIEKDLKEKTNL